jgi:sugar (pentulose or hexulose) kinase
MWLGTYVWIAISVGEWQNKVGLYVVNGGHDEAAQSVGNGENDEAEQCEIGVSRSVAVATVTDSPVKSLDATIQR